MVVVGVAAVGQIQYSSTIRHNILIHDFYCHADGWKELYASALVYTVTHTTNAFTYRGNVQDISGVFILELKN